MLKRRVKSLLGLAILSVSMASALSSCTSDNTSNQTEEKVIQTLNGSGSINDTNYDFELRILEADNEFYIKTLNTEYENIWGEWTFTEGKGYILTFDDAYWTEKKVKYNEDSKEFFFTYEVNLGSAVGKTKVKFSGSADNFTYDGEGWGFEPFEFSASNLDVMGMTTIDITLTCYEDLTFKTLASCPLIAVPERNGTYSFDEANKVYTFKFSDEENPTETTYADGTYSLTLKLNVGMPMQFTITYTPEA